MSTTSKKAKVTFIENGMPYGYAYLKGQEGEVSMADLAKLSNKKVIIPSSAKDLETAKASLKKVEKRG